MPDAQKPAAHAVLLHPNDHVCVAARDLMKGDTISVAGQSITARVAVPLGHKVAHRPAAKGETILKHGQPIGIATAEIAPGDWVHSHNLTAGEFSADYAKATDAPPPPAPIADRMFDGYRRAGGKAGTRNYLAVISTVNCTASVCKYITRRFDRSTLAEYPNIDGVIALTHDTGCGMQFSGLKHELINRTLGGMARHPNIGAFLLIGLGCEQTSAGYLIEQERLVQIDGATASQPAGSPIVLTMQDLGGTQATVERGIELVAQLLPRADDVRREPISASQLIVGTECGGSDGNSGVTANPAVGVASDRIVAAGGTTVLSETSEIVGAEHLLTRRSRSVEVADRLLERIRWWENYVGNYGVEFEMNPSLGNKAGGLTTIVEKSLGAIAKGGATSLNAVYEYAEPITEPGLVFMDTPGFDPVSITGKMAGGANLIVFTTGRGSCYGCKPVPSIKIASNTPMYARLQDDMDIDAGRILAGTSVEQLGEEIFDEILAVASGKQTKSEQHGIGEEEFIPWIVGPTL